MSRAAPVRVPQFLAGIFGGQRGSAGMLALVLLPLLMTIGGIYSMLAMTEISTATGYRDGLAAQYLAEAGARRAIVELNKNPSWGGAGDTALGSGATAGFYQVGVTGSGNRRTVVATGKVGKATRKIRVIVDVPAGAAFPYAAFSGERLTVESGFAVTGGNIASATDQVISHEPAVAVITQVSGVTLPAIPVSFNKNDYLAGANTTDLSGRPVAGTYELTGRYVVDGGLTVDPSAALYCADGRSATVFVDGNVAISGEITGNVSIIAAGDLEIDSGVALKGNIQLYSQGDVILRRSLTNGLYTVMAQRNVTVNGSSGELNKARIYAGETLVFNSGARLRGIAAAKKELLLNGGTINYVRLSFEPVESGNEIAVIAWSVN